MRRHEAIAWVVSVCSVSLRLSQAKTLAILAASALSVERVSLAHIGRHMQGSGQAPDQTLLAVLPQSTC
jgi:hypothetical protein